MFDQHGWGKPKKVHKMYMLCTFYKPLVYIINDRYTCQPDRKITDTCKEEIEREEATE